MSELEIDTTMDVPAIGVTAALALTGALAGLWMPGRRVPTEADQARAVRATPDSSPCGHRIASVLEAEVGG